jgi:hypothetical protein
MEGALDADVVDYFPADAEICAHMQTVGLERINLFVFTPIEYNVLSRDVYGFDISRFEFIGTDDVVPSVGVGRRGSADILLLGVICSLHQEVCLGELGVVACIKQREG